MLLPQLAGAICRHIAAFGYCLLTARQRCLFLLRHGACHAAYLLPPVFLPAYILSAFADFATPPLRRSLMPGAASARPTPTHAAIVFDTLSSFFLRYCCRRHHFVFDFRPDFDYLRACLISFFCVIDVLFFSLLSAFHFLLLIRRRFFAAALRFLLSSFVSLFHAPALASITLMAFLRMSRIYAESAAAYDFIVSRFIGAFADSSIYDAVATT